MPGYYLFAAFGMTLIFCLFGCDYAEKSDRVEANAVCGQNSALNAEYENLISAFACMPDNFTDGAAESGMRNFSDCCVRLCGHGYDAFPALLRHFDDSRSARGIPVEAVNTTVGDACYYVVMLQLFDYPDGYDGYPVQKLEQRPGADGKTHARTGYLFFADAQQKRQLRDWILSQKCKSLTELKMAYIEKLIEQENQIGYCSTEDEKMYLMPLQRNLQRFKADRGK